VKVQFDKSYPMPCSPEVAWRFLQDLEAVAGCMPGATITERLTANRYKGTVTAKLGPAAMSFRGEVEMLDVDASARSLRLVGKGTDTTGSSGASLALTARVEPAPGGLCALVGRSEMSMSGKAATFGGRMMDSVVEQILKQFADNFAGRVKALETERGRQADPGAGVTQAGNGPGAAAPSQKLNVLALLWAVVLGWLRGLFAHKPS
jgi:uncharacterized protein